MKIGIVYYSRIGNTENIAKRIEKEIRNRNIDVDTIKIEHVKKPSFLKAAYYAVIRRKEPPIANKNFDLGEYDKLIIGSPVWVGKPAPFIKTFISLSTNIKVKNCAVFLTCAGNREACKKTIEMLLECLQKIGIKTTKDYLILKMKKGEIIEGEEEIDEFLQKILDY